MHESFKLFMEEIIDYAGLFPPAGLPLERALHNYRDYRMGPYRWMLSRFIIPAGKLPEIESCRKTLMAEGEPYRFSLLGAKTDTVPEFMEELDQVITCCDRVHESYGQRVTTDILEIKLPVGADFGDRPERFPGLLDKVVEKLDRSEDLPRKVYLETAMEAEWEREIASILPAISRTNQQSSWVKFGFKLRCGGTEPDHFPTSQKVAVAINRARDHGVAVKCTAGLHHPVRFFSDELSTKMHGFLNVFGGGMLAHKHQLNDAVLVEILNDEDDSHFSFDAHTFKWKDYELHAGEIAELRETALLSFGSCSFREPVEDLKVLELLD